MFWFYLQSRIKKIPIPVQLVSSIKFKPIFNEISSNWLEIDRYIGRYLDFTDISVSAKTADIIGLNRSWQNAVIFLTHPDNLRKKAQRNSYLTTTLAGAVS